MAIMRGSPIRKAWRTLVCASVLAAPTLTGCATLTGIVTGPVVMPVSWFRLSKPGSMPADLIWAPFCLLAVPFFPFNGVLGAVCDFEYLKSGSYGGVLERKEMPDGGVRVRRGHPFTAVFDPCAYLLWYPWETEHPASPLVPAASSPGAGPPPLPCHSGSPEPP